MPVVAVAWVVEIGFAISTMGSLGLNGYFIDAASQITIAAFFAIPILGFVAIAIDRSRSHAAATIVRTATIGLVTLALIAAAALMVIAIGTPPRF